MVLPPHLAICADGTLITDHVAGGKKHEGTSNLIAKLCREMSGCFLAKSNSCHFSSSVTVPMDLGLSVLFVK
jgi:hypothetical protein